MTNQTRTIRRFIYQFFYDNERAPKIADIAQAFALDEAIARSTFQKLANGKALVLHKESDEILMAEPYSAIPTGFLVKTAGKSFWGNCIWDAMGILAMLKSDGEVQTSCGHSGSEIILHFADGRLRNPQGIIHYLLPVNEWWRDVLFT